VDQDEISMTMEPLYESKSHCGRYGFD
jgi:hypothetical protein